MIWSRYTTLVVPRSWKATGSPQLLWGQYYQLLCHPSLQKSCGKEPDLTTIALCLFSTGIWPVKAMACWHCVRHSLCCSAVQWGQDRTGLPVSRSHNWLLCCPPLSCAQLPSLCLRLGACTTIVLCTYRHIKKPMSLV